VAAKDLKIAALVDAEPDALSRRMQLLQGALPSEQHLILAVRPSVLEPKLRKCRGVGQVNLWRVPFEAVLYHRFGRDIAAASDPGFAKFRFIEGGVFNPGTPLSKGRNLHLQGRFEKEDEKPGARALYLSSRQPDQNINRFESSQVLREAAGIQQQLPKDEQQQKEMIESFAHIARTQKHHATYWLGLTYHEAGNQAGAIEWLAERAMEAYPPSPWIPGARYNLARCYEDLGQWDAARKWLESDKDSPQRHGNLLRAKWIAQRHPQAAAPAVADEGSEPKAAVNVATP
jgi:tetratricopeptide (TPR) repeat protein